MTEFIEHKDFYDALDNFKKKHPDCKIETFSNDVRQIIGGFGIKEYPPVDRSFPKYLVKVGQEKHMLPLLKQGIVYMNSLSYFKSLEHTEDGRADESEGAHSVVQTGGMIINGLEINVSTPLTFFAPGYNKGYIYCTVAVFDDTKPEEFLNERMLDMGEVAITEKSLSLHHELCSAARDKRQVLPDVMLAQGKPLRRSNTLKIH